MVERSILASLVALSARRASAVLLLGAVLAVLSAALATRLSVTTDIDGLFNASLPWKQREAELKRLFPQRQGLLVAAVDAPVPEAAEAAAAGLAAALARDGAHFQSVRRPDASPFFDRNGLLFLDTPALSAVLDQTIDAQPFLGQLVADPSARGLFAALSLVAVGVEKGAELGPFEAALRGAKPDAARAEGLRAFVDQVSAAVPNAGGPAVTVAATAQTIISAFERAAAGAVLAITVILFASLRRVLDVALVLAPLLLSALLTVVAAAWLPLPLNSANVIALPLLLGVGVSFNIYFVMELARRAAVAPGVAHGAGGGVLGAHHGHGVRLAGAVRPPRHCEHGCPASA